MCTNLHGQESKASRLAFTCGKVIFLIAAFLLVGLQFMHEALRVAFRGGPRLINLRKGRLSSKSDHSWRQMPYVILGFGATSDLILFVFWRFKSADAIPCHFLP